MGLLSARERGGVCAPVFCRGAHKGLFGETRVKEQCKSPCKKKVPGSNIQVQQFQLIECGVLA